ncbi:MAG: glycosyl hydrolase 53 family protein [Roseburia sp.]|nr:glycosyl hydrolase 53 family protein [Roseburia sp.]
MQFIKGADVSLTDELEERNAVYYLNGEKKDLFEILKECGINMVRLRLWNHPYSEEGEPYGGGCNDLETTIKLAKRVVKNEMQLMLDFHYSDFWADPAKQFKPKAWVALQGEELERVVYEYTKETLLRLKTEELMPAVVQVGNEITNGFLWPDGHVENLEQMARLLKEGIRAVREICPDAKIMLHLDFGTNNELYNKWFSDIEPYNLDYDIIGMSYYPYWNGSLDLLVENMNDISSRFDKDVIIAETAIGYTTDNLGCKVAVYSEELEKKTAFTGTKEGQKQFLETLYGKVKQVKNQRGIGVVYWEPAWLPIPDCAWALPTGCEYMNDKAELGNSWGNQALFDADGNANPALIHIKNL